MTVPAFNMQPLDSASFEVLAALAYRESGLTLAAEKAGMIQSRLRHRLNALRLDSFADYSALVQSEDGIAERRHLISALTTNVSHFFREAHHFDMLLAAVRRKLPLLRAGGRCRIWSAGCSNGQEPLSAAITLMEHLPEVAALDLRILATDIDPNVVRTARLGTYPERLTSGLPQDLREKYFSVSQGDTNEVGIVPFPCLRNMIRYNELNLLGPWPMRHAFDAIFCRNVVIYFDLGTQTGLWPRYRAALADDGLLFLGHSERIAEPQRFGFVCAGQTCYRPAAA